MTREEAINWLMAISFVSDRHITEALNMAIEALSADTVSREHHDMEIKELKHQIKDQTDMVSVVRCKDCKFKCLYDEGDTKYYYCALEDRPNRNWSVDDTDYCSWAEEGESDA